MKNIHFLITLIFISIIKFTFTQIIDTIDSQKGKILIYANRTWEYIEDQNFNGVLNEHLYSLINYFQNCLRWDGQGKLKSVSPSRLSLLPS